MVIKSVNLETVCGITSRLPEHEKPEVAFAGKSNVGKSSLINGLMNRKSYARISATPGKTQTFQDMVMRRFRKKKRSSGESWWNATSTARPG